MWKDLTTAAVGSAYTNLACSALQPQLTKLSILRNPNSLPRLIYLSAEERGGADGPRGHPVARSHSAGHPRDPGLCEGCGWLPVDTNDLVSLGWAAAGYLPQIRVLGNSQGRVRVQCTLHTTNQQCPLQQPWFCTEPSVCSFLCFLDSCLIRFGSFLLIVLFQDEMTIFIWMIVSCWFQWISLCNLW